MGEEVPASCAIAVVVEPRAEDQVCRNAKEDAAERGAVSQKCQICMKQFTLHLHNNKPGKEAPACARVAGFFVLILAAITLLARMLGVPSQPQHISILLLSIVLPDESSVFVLQLVLDGRVPLAIIVLVLVLVAILSALVIILLLFVFVILCSSSRRRSLLVLILRSPLAFSASLFRIAQELDDGLLGPSLGNGSGERVFTALEDQPKALLLRVRV